MTVYLGKSNVKSKKQKNAQAPKRFLPTWGPDKRNHCRVICLRSHLGAFQAVMTHKGHTVAFATVKCRDNWLKAQHARFYAEWKTERKSKRKKR